MAIGCGQWSWLAGTTHIDQISHLADRESLRYGNLGPAIALYYDEGLRKKWASLARQKDPNMSSVKDLEKAAANIDEHELEIARTKVGSVLKKAGLTSGSLRPALAVL